MHASVADKSEANQDLEQAIAALQHDPAHCVHRHIARTARVVAARFDEALSHTGFTAGQFTIVMTLARRGALSMGQLADELAMDPTTLSRVIRPLLNREWVELTRGPDRRVRVATATDAGIRKAIDALPVWQQTQVAALALIDSRWGDLRHGIAALRHGLRGEARRRA